MLDNPLVESLLTEIVQDEENLPIIKCLEDGISTDEEIAEKTEIRLNIVRKVLYKLYDAGLASYKRSKDPETQWFTYNWIFERDEVNKQIKDNSEKTIKHLKKILEEEENNMFFICPDGHTRFDFETATYYGFICPECGEEVVFQDNQEIIERIKEEIKIHEDTYNFVNAEIGKN